MIVHFLCCREARWVENQCKPRKNYGNTQNRNAAHDVRLFKTKFRRFSSVEKSRRGLQISNISLFCALFWDGGGIYDQNLFTSGKQTSRKPKPLRRISIVLSVIVRAAALFRTVSVFWSLTVRSLSAAAVTGWTDKTAHTNSNQQGFIFCRCRFIRVVSLIST